MSTVLTQGIAPGEFIMSEAGWHRSREGIAIPASQTVLPGGLLAAKAVPANVTQAQSRSGTGDGVLTFSSPATSALVKPGRYKVTFTGTGATAPFNVEAPDGSQIGNGAVGTAFNKEVKFTVADGAADFVAGDQIFLDIAVDQTDYEYVPWAPAATDGTENVAAIAIYGVVTGVGETKKIAAIVREAEVNGHCLTLPEGVTAAQLAKAYNDLALRQIIVRN